jgi:hypothetical protein
MKRNPWLLPLVLFLSLGLIYVLPKAGETAQSAVRMDLPGYMGGWSFEPLAATKEEIGTLGKGTNFSKAICTKVRVGQQSLSGDLLFDRLDISIVLSGRDLNTSIHRPERCMPAQGHINLISDDVVLRIEDQREFKVKRIHSTQVDSDPKTGKVLRSFNCLTYYFFVGHDKITNDHLQRTLRDMKDRLVYGRDQRWAYVSTSMWYGKLPWLPEEVTEAEADRKMRKFLSEFGERQIDWDQIKP